MNFYFFDAKDLKRINKFLAIFISGRAPSWDRSPACPWSHIQSPLSAAVRTLQAVADAKANGVDAAQDAGESKPEASAETEVAAEPKVEDVSEEQKTENAEAAPIDVKKPEKKCV